MGFLDNTGLGTLWKNIVGKSVPYGYCTTGASTKAKTVTVSPAITALETGMTIAVRFQYSNTASSPTLNVNNLGAKSIYRYGTTVPGTSAAASWNANAIHTLTYNGSGWILDNWNNTTYSTITDAEYQAGTSTSSRLVTPARLKAAIQYWATGEANVQSNWNETDSTSDAYILNKPTKLSDFTNDSGFITSFTEADPIFTASPAHGITSNDIANWNAAEPNVNADWNATSGDAQILNKPTILEPLIGTSANITPSQVMTAVDEGRDIVIYHAGDIDGVDTNFTFTSWNRATDIDYSGAMLDVVVSDTIASLNNQFYLYELVGGTFQGAPMSWTLISTVLAKKTDIPTNVSAFNNDVGYLRSESDPTVPAWAKASSKPTYTASEVGAQETLVSGMNIKTINGDSILGSGNLVVSGGGSEPTMQTLSVTSGGTGTWYYRTWPSGWQEAWYQGSIQFTSAASSAGGWYRSTKNFALPISFADNACIQVSGSTSGRVYTQGGIKTSGTQFEAQILGGAALAANTYSGWSVYVAGYGRS